MDDPAQQIIDFYRDQLLANEARMRAMERALRRAYCCCPDPDCVAHEDWCPMVDVLAEIEAEVRRAQ